MPAIHLPRLRKQIHELADACADPDKFLRKLQELFEYYGDRTLRPSQLAAKPTAIPSANVPSPVLRHLVNGLTPHAVQTPHLIFDLSRELWKFGWTEHRLLASQLLGKLPLEDPEEISSLVEEWCLENHEEVLLESIANHSLTRLQAENPGFLISKAAVWIGSRSRKSSDSPPLPAASLTNLKRLGLRALIPLISDPEFENLPKIFTALDEITEDPPKILRPDLLDTLRALASRSPAETAFFLRQLYHANPSKTTTWLIRRSLLKFPEDAQASLRTLINPAKPSLN